MSGRGSLGSGSGGATASERACTCSELHLACLSVARLLTLVQVGKGIVDVGAQRSVELPLRPLASAWAVLRVQKGQQVGSAARAAQRPAHPSTTSSAISTAAAGTVRCGMPILTLLPITSRCPPAANLGRGGTVHMCG